MESGPPQIPLSLQYATPLGYQTEGMWRDGNRVAVNLKPGGTLCLTARCIKCNAATDGTRGWRKTMCWHPPGFYVLILFPGLLIYVIVALCIRKKVTVDAGLCPLHRKVRRQRIAIGWLAGISGIFCIVAAIFFWSDPQWRRGPLGAVFGILAAVLIVFSLIWALFATRVLTIRKMKNGTMWFSGAGLEFLASLSQP
jgi:hypothetical protein